MTARCGGGTTDEVDLAVEAGRRARYMDGDRVVPDRDRVARRDINDAMTFDWWGIFSSWVIVSVLIFICDQARRRRNNAQ